MNFNIIHLFTVACFIILVSTVQAQILMAGQCNKDFRIGLKTLNSSTHPQKITYHGKVFPLRQCLGIPERGNSVQCSFVYKKCEDRKCDRPDLRYYTFTYKEHVKGSTNTKKHGCVISRIIKSLEEPHDIKTAEMGNTVLVESLFSVNGHWKYSYDKFKISEFKYLDLNNL